MFKILFALMLSLSFLSTAKAQTISNLKTPNVSANALFLYRNSNLAGEDLSEERNGIDLQEAEVAFYSEVDPYSRLFLLLAIHPEYELNEDENVVEQSWTLEPEELYVDSLSLPNFTLKIGKFKSNFGKYNILHTHALPFVEAPLAHRTLLGDEGLNDVGASLSYLLPLSWFSEWSAEYLRGEGENEQFNSPTPGDGIGVTRWKNLFDLSDDLTIEIGASYARGRNSLGKFTDLYGADLTFKWRPAEGGKYRSFLWSTEYLGRSIEQPGVSDETGTGVVSWIQYQWSQRWYALYRYEFLEIQDSNAAVNANALDNGFTTKNSVAARFAASEFSAFSLEYNWSKLPVAVNNETEEHKVFFQANFTIGAHPAHAY